MTPPLQWQDSPQASSIAHPLMMSTANPWSAISIGLLGLIIGFVIHRFIIPTTFGASANLPSNPNIAQGIVVQPSPTPPPANLGGGGCGCGGGGACGAVAPVPSPTS